MPAKIYFNQFLDLNDKERESERVGRDDKIEDEVQIKFRSYASKHHYFETICGIY